MTTTQQSTVVGVFDERAMAERAVDQLRQAGFSDDQISFSAHNTSTGGIFSGLKNLFTRRGSDTDNVVDDLTGMGMPEEDAQYYHQQYESGRSIVAVTGGSRMEEAASILARYGAYGANRGTTQASDARSSMNTTTEQRLADTTSAANTTDMAETAREHRIQLREEQLQVYKQTVQVGEVGLRKKVVTEQQTINVPANHEEVFIERQPGSGRIADTPIGEDETIRIPVSKEQVNVAKQVVATEEVKIGKRQVQETRQVSDTVQREEAQIEREGNVPIHGTRTDPFHPSQTNVEDLLADS